MATTSELAHDFRFAVRFLHRHPNYSLTTLATLVLTIAAVTTMFTLVSRVVLQPLPLPDPHELVAVRIVDARTGAAQRSESIPFATFEEWQQSAPAQADLAWAVIESSVLTESDVGVYAAGHFVSHNFLAMIGTPPLLGRWFTSDEAGQPVIVISFEMWQRDLGGDPAIIGRAISLDKQPLTVVGVMPQGYLQAVEPRVRYWRPVDGFGRGGAVLGRVRDGASAAALQSLNAPLQRIVQREAGEFAISTVPLLDKVLGATRARLWLLMAGVTALFLVAVLNLTNLTFACLYDRLRELTTRTALGASRGRLVAQLFVENLSLCALAALASIPATAWLLDFALAIMPASFPRRSEIAVDPSVWAFAALLSIGTGMLVTSITAARLVDPARLIEQLQHAGARLAGSLGNLRLRRLLIAAQVGVSLTLLIAVGLLLRSYAKLLSQDAGFAAQQIVTGHVWRPEGLSDAQAAQAFERVLTEIEALPEVGLVAAASTIPMGPMSTRVDPTIAFSYSGQLPLQPGEETRTALRTVSDDFFRVLDVPLLSGRFFDGRERTSGNRTIIVNRAMADWVWPDADPLGRELLLAQPSGSTAYTVVGVVENYRFAGLAAEFKPEIFLSMSQRVFGGASYLARVDTGDIAEAMQTIATAASALDNSMPMIEVHSLDELVRASVSGEQSVLSLLSGFAIFATLLAGIGIYGLTRYLIGCRRREIAIRIALGAHRSRIRLWVMRDALLPALAGVALGLLVTVPVVRLLDSFLFGVAAWDLPAYAGALGVVLTVAALAPLGPAGGAARLDPQQALKTE